MHGYVVRERLEGVVRVRVCMYFLFVKESWVLEIVCMACIYWYCIVVFL